MAVDRRRGRTRQPAVSVDDKMSSFLREIYKPGSRPLAGFGHLDFQIAAEAKPIQQALEKTHTDMLYAENGCRKACGQRPKHIIQGLRTSSRRADRHHANDP